MNVVFKETHKMSKQFIQYTMLYTVVFCIGCANNTVPKIQTQQIQKETSAQEIPERQVTIPWIARIKSSPEGAEVFLLANDRVGQLLGKTPLDVNIWTEVISGHPGQSGMRKLTLHLPVLRTKDGWYRGFVVKQGNIEVKRYASLRDELPNDAPGGLAYDLRLGKGIWCHGNIETQVTIPASYDKDFPPPLISEINVDFASEGEQQVSVQNESNK
jgi:hypothetical protein